MSATVLHGRRKGQNRGTPDPPAEMSLPSPDVRQVTVLTKTDWDRISGQLNKRAMEEERVRKQREEKLKMYEKSKDQVKNWSNTIAGQRQKKLEARKLREGKEEEERKVVDIEEAKFQAQKRREAIEKAKTQQYYQTDRVKGFHGALLLTEVLKERDAQIELRRLKEQASSGQDDEWLRRAQEEYEQQILRDQDEARQRIKHTRDTAEFQKAQVREHLRGQMNEAKEDDIEGQELKKLAAQYELEKKRLQEIREAEAKQLMADNVRQISDVHKMREINQWKEEEEDEECRIFAAAKRKMMKLRAEKEKQLHKEKQDSLEKIRNKLHAQMQQKLDDEDDRIRRAVEESEARMHKEDAEKEEKNRAAHRAMGEHRHQQLKEKEKQEAAARRKELEMLLVKKQADEVFAQNEETKRNKKLAEAEDLKNFHFQQASERDTMEKMIREQQLAQDKKNQDLLSLEEQQFQEYANKVINHCEKGGRNVYPLRKAAREGAGGGSGPVFPGKGGVRPSYMVSDQSGVQMPYYQRSTTDETKENIYGDGVTSKRLGFVW